MFSLLVNEQIGSFDQLILDITYVISFTISFFTDIQGNTCHSFCKRRYYMFPYIPSEFLLMLQHLIFKQFIFSLFFVRAIWVIIKKKIRDKT